MTESEMSIRMRERFAKLAKKGKPEDKDYCDCDWARRQKWKDDHPWPARTTVRGRPKDCEKCYNTGYVEKEQCGDS
jgi:hypothetical protein